MALLTEHVRLKHQLFYTRLHGVTHQETIFKKEVELKLT